MRARTGRVARTCDACNVHTPDVRGARCPACGALWGTRAECVGCGDDEVRAYDAHTTDGGSMRVQMCEECVGLVGIGWWANVERVTPAQAGDA